MIIKNLMKNFILRSLLMLTLTVTSAQEFQGKAYYISKTTMDPNFGANIPPERRQRFMDRMKSNLEKNYELDFNSTASTFYNEERLDNSGGSGRFNFMSFMSPFQGILHKEFASKTFTNRVELFGKIFLIKDSLPESKWLLSGESKQIGNYTVYKATMSREVPQEVFQFGRQNSEENQPKMKTVNITAWFTPQIPVSTGPYKYGGLPGLILEVNSDNTTVLCTKVVINPKEKMKIKAPQKGTVVNTEEYDKIRTEKIAEMREMYRRNGGNSRGNFRSR